MLFHKIILRLVHLRQRQGGETLHAKEMLVLKKFPTATDTKPRVEKLDKTVQRTAKTDHSSKRPKTLFSRSEVRAAAFVRISTSLSATFMKRPDKALPVTYAPNELS